MFISAIGFKVLHHENSATLTHKFAADVHIHFISCAFDGTLFHADKAVSLVTRPILPVPIL